MSTLGYAIKIVNELSAFLATKSNIHNKISVFVTKFQKALQNKADHP